MADDLGYEALGCYGGTSYRTPVLDGMAESGIRFVHGYAQPLCTPTRVQLMTGKYNFRNWKAFGVMDPDEKTIGHYMTDAGYKTCISGKWQLYSYNPSDYEPEWRGKGKRPEQAGFDEYCLWHTEHTEEKGSRYADPKVQVNGKYLEDTEGKYGPDIYVDYINDFMERNQSDPFFVYYPMALTHPPYQPTPDSEDWAVDRHRTDTKYFKDMVEYHDKVIGRILNKVDELGLSENTLIIYYGDNGTTRNITSYMNGRAVQGGKGYSTDAGTRVPLIVKWAGVSPKGVVLEDLVDASDFLPTILEAAGAPLPKDEVIDGRSFLPQIRGEKGCPREWVFFHHDPLPGHGKDGYHLQRWAQDKRWKLYDDGRFYDVVNDVLEENPLSASQGGPEADAARVRLQKILHEMK